MAGFEPVKRLRSQRCERGTIGRYWADVTPLAISTNRYAAGESAKSAQQGDVPVDGGLAKRNCAEGRKLRLRQHGEGRMLIPVPSAVNARAVVIN